MVQLPIPDDWESGEYECVQILWPNSPKWLALLAGFITSPSRGRYWKGTTGSILEAQEIGRELDGINLPFMSCAGTEIIIQKEYIRQYIEAEESDFLMSLCGYNPKAFKIENGQLWVRDFCGEWVAIGSITATSGGEVPPIEEIPDPPPDGYTYSTACAKVSKIAVMAYNIVAQGVVSIEGAGALDPWDFYNDMNDAFQGIDLAFNDVMNLFFMLPYANAFGVTGELLETGYIDQLKCHWEELVSDGNQGITSDEYDAMKGAMKEALRAHRTDDAYSGFGQTMRNIWEHAIKSIGAKDVEKLSYWAQPAPGEDCACPEPFDPNAATDPDANGWYWSALMNGPVTAIPHLPGGSFPYDTWGYPYAAITADHDVYGMRWSHQVLVAGSIVSMKRSNDPAPGIPYDFRFSESNSGNLPWSGDFCMVADSLYASLFPASEYDNSWKFNDKVSSVIASPKATAGQKCIFTISAQVSNDNNPGSMQIYGFRLLHNVNSPSHA